jgi:hypothetical protein
MAAKLPANRIIGAAFGHVFANVGPLARAAAVPFGVMVVGALRGELATQEGHMALYAAVLWTLIQLAAIVPFQTQVYRFAVGITSDSAPRLGWPWSMRETRFVLNALALMLLTAAAMAVAIVIAAGLAGGDVATMPNESLGRFVSNFTLVGLPVAVLVLYVNARLSFVLAAASVGRSANWRDIWRATSGNGWRIVWIMIVATVPWLLLGAFIEKLANSVTSMPILALLGLATSAVSLLAIALPATALGLAYRHLVIDGGAKPPTVSLLA